MISVYTCGYMAGKGVDRYNWRNVLVQQLDGWPIRWLHPGVPPGDIPGQGNRMLYGPRDVAQIIECHVLFAYMDLEIARCLGASWEMGAAFAYDKRIIMVDKSLKVGSLDLNRWGADSVWTTLEEGAMALKFIAEGFK